ncbi:MAG: dephospho-CoA kinase [Alistipes sp.]|nr:dephospho-CoA kinase [Alistipes sp.]
MENPSIYKIGITGGIGSGKSTVCRLLADMGVPVYDSDARAKALMNDSEALRTALIEAFGEECYNAEGLNRPYLASRVFGDAEALAQLNAIVHPAVREDFRAWADVQSSRYVVLESAILFEAGFENEVDTTLAVLAPLEERVRRTAERDGVDRESVLKRIAHQISDEELHRRANRTLVNLRMDYLESDVEQLHKMYCYEAGRQ